MAVVVLMHVISLITINGDHWDGVMSIVTLLWARLLRNRSISNRAGDFPLFEISMLAHRPTVSFIKWGPEAVLPGIKWLGLEADD